MEEVEIIASSSDDDQDPSSDWESELKLPSTSKKILKMKKVKGKEKIAKIQTKDLEATKNRIFSCSHPGCEYKNKSMEEVMKHLMSSHMKADFQCPICKFVTSDEEEYDQHVVTHEKKENNLKRKKSEPKKSQDSERSSSVQKDQKQSLVKGGTKKTFVCEFPGCKFTTHLAYSLLKHKAIHNPNRPRFKCSQCGHTFYRRHDLNKHIRNLHNDVSDIDRRKYVSAANPSSAKKYTRKTLFACNFPGCNQKFRRPDYLREHMKTHDPNRPKFKCSLCSITYSRHYRLNNHIRARHRDISDTDRSKYVNAAARISAEGPKMKDSTKAKSSAKTGLTSVCVKKKQSSAVKQISKEQRVNNRRQTAETSADKQASPDPQAVSSPKTTTVEKGAAVHMFQCKLCPYSTKWWRCIISHRRLHKSKTAMICPILNCGYRADRMCNMRDHMRSQHNTSYPPSVPANSDWNKRETSHSREPSSQGNDDAVNDPSRSDVILNSAKDDKTSEDDEVTTISSVSSNRTLQVGCKDSESLQSETINNNGEGEAISDLSSQSGCNDDVSSKYQNGSLKKRKRARRRWTERKRIRRHKEVPGSVMTATADSKDTQCTPVMNEKPEVRQPGKRLNGQRSGHCPKCGMYYSHLQRHMKTHEYQFPYVCTFPHCQRRIKYWDNLIGHLRISHGFKLSKKKFSSRSGVRPYACSIAACNFRTRHPEYLEIHMKQPHPKRSGEERTKKPLRKEFTCSVSGCNYGSNFAKNLRRHVQRMHQQQSKLVHEAKGPQHFTCSESGCTFWTKYARTIRNHLKNVHQLKPTELAKNPLMSFKPFVCSVIGCEYRSGYNKNLERHLNLKHGFPATLKPSSLRSAEKVVTSAPKNKLQSKGSHFTQPQLQGMPAASDILEIYACTAPNCKFQWKSAFAVRMHAQEAHPTLKIFKIYGCSAPNCNFSTKYCSNLSAHFSNHHPSMKARYVALSCTWPGCDFRPKSSANLVFHLRSHSRPSYWQSSGSNNSERNLYNCDSPGCNFSTEHRGTLRTHLVNSHRYKNSRIRNIFYSLPRLNCTFPNCSFSSIYSSSVYLHYRNVHSGIRYSRRPSMNLSMDLRSRRERNVQIISEVKNYKKSVARPDQEGSDSAVVVEEVEDGCTYCNYVARLSSFLRRHLKPCSEHDKIGCEADSRTKDKSGGEAEDKTCCETNSQTEEETVDSEANRTTEDETDNEAEQGPCSGSESQAEQETGNEANNETEDKTGSAVDTKSQAKTGSGSADEDDKAQDETDNNCSEVSTNSSEVSSDVQQSVFQCALCNFVTDSQIGAMKHATTHRRLVVVLERLKLS